MLELPIFYPGTTPPPNPSSNKSFIISNTVFVGCVTGITYECMRLHKKGAVPESYFMKRRTKLRRTSMGVE